MEDPKMRFDPRMLGRLSDVRPLNTRESESLWRQMRTSSDRSAFKRIEASSNEIRNSIRVLGDSAAGHAVGEFAKEFADRLEARNLRDLAERVKDRDQQRNTTRSR